MQISLRRLALLLAALLIAQPAIAAQRVALIFGNAEYRHAKQLVTPANDVDALAKQLRKLNFEVLIGKNLDRQDMLSMIQRFANRAATAEVALFYYGGHGLHIGNTNYLVPVDAKLLIADYVALETISLKLVDKAIANASQARFIILDAALHNPLLAISRYRQKNGSPIAKGLAAVEAKPKSIYAFSAPPGRVFPILTGRKHSEFANALIGRLKATRGDLRNSISAAKRDVVRSTAGNQEPWIVSNLRTPVLLSAEPPKTAVAKPSAAKPSQSYVVQAELAVWTTVKDSRDPKLIRVYLDQYPNGLFSKTARALLTNLEQKTALTVTNPPAVIAAPAKPKPPKTKQPAPEDNKANQTENTEPSSASRPIDAPPTRTEPKVLVTQIQKELIRLKCYKGAVDGKWNTQTQNAIESVAKVQKTSVESAFPSASTVRLLKGMDGAACAPASPPVIAKPTAKPEPKAYTKKRTKERSYKKRRKAYTKRSKKPKKTRKKRQSRKKYYASRKKYEKRRVRRARSSKPRKRPVKSNRNKQPNWKKFWEEQSDKSEP